MFMETRILLIWISWFIAGLCGVAILLIVICHCGLMQRHHKSFDEEYLNPKENARKEEPRGIKTYQEPNYRIINEVNRSIRPVSYGGPVHYTQMKKSNVYEYDRPGPSRHSTYVYVDSPIDAYKDINHQQYASSSILDDIDEIVKNPDAIKSRSLPAFMRQKPRPLSTEDDLQQLYAKVQLTKKYKRRMRNEHAAIIAMCKSQSMTLDADAVVIYDQRTAL